MCLVSHEYTTFVRCFASRKYVIININNNIQLPTIIETESEKVFFCYKRLVVCEAHDEGECLATT